MALELFLFTFFVIGVFGDVDEVVSVSVMEGDSVTLRSDVTDVHDVIEWRFQGFLIARVNRESNKVSKKITYYGGFKDRLELDIQSGDLKIKNIRNTDTGEYKLKITSTESSSKIFNITAVSDPRSDGVTVVSVMKGDSVVLHTGVPKIQNDDEILWRFRDKDVIAKIKKDEHIHSTYDHSADGIFRSRLHLNLQTGDIIIRDIRNSTSGLYEVDFKKSSYTTHKSFNVIVSDQLNRVQVKEGVFVTLGSGLTNVEGDDLVQWRFEHESHVIAKINKTASSSSTSDGANGRFRGRLELDDETGSLTIRKIAAEHTGLYHLDITGSKHTIFKKFIVFVCAVPDPGLSPAAVAGIVVGVGVFLLVVAAAIYYYQTMASITYILKQKENISILLNYHLTVCN
ncbi:uncharacterized protein LOC113081390 [Carassius auratus]|uniref:Uncharacterized protein LOC113081390 n=1 Tax=Carassius auratus TaxID=7957 RepID=A0A6P6NM59_CARAU|nr:uncharacterized protein LOC113081390 [Carassius auratus]